MSKYITLASNNGIGVIVVSSNSKTNFKHYLFDTNSLTKEDVGQVRKLINENNFRLKNAVFLDCSDQLSIPKGYAVIVAPDKKCGAVGSSRVKNGLIIPQLSDGGAIFRIINDNVCKKYELGRYPHNFSLSDFAIESLSEKHFCQKFITDPNATL